MIILHRSVYVLIGVTIVVISGALLVVFTLFKDSPTEEIASESTTTQAISDTDSRTQSIAEFPLATTTVATSAPAVVEAEPVVKMAEPAKTIQKNDDTVTPQKTTKKAPADTNTSSGIETEGILAEHNYARSSAGVGAFTWSAVIAKSAQKWSDQLKSENCKMRHDPATPYGENIYWAWSSYRDTEGLISYPSEVVDAWVREESFYNYEKNTCKAGEQCGHYTQVVWESTTEVGCGVSSCMDGDAQTDIWVCRYNPAGNDGTRPF